MRSVLFTGWRARALGGMLLAVAALSGGCGTSAPLPEQAVVLRVIDGDTVKLADGRLLRYLGIDTPEVRRRSGGGWVVDPEPFAREASAFNRRQVERRRVRLEYDRKTHDRFGRLLAYVFVDGVMVNRQLLEAGLAEVLIIPPNGKYAAEFRAIAASARLARRGLWEGED